MSLSRRKEAPLDPFKRAVTLTTRSIARDAGVEVVFTSEPPGLAGKTARVPEPSRIPTKSEIAVIRGHADAAALSIACHDPRLHASLAPSGVEARAVFEAIEQARVEAIGAKRMQGVAANLAARIEQRYERSRFSEATDRAEAPIEDALALLVRERLTGQAPPPKARAIVNLWRPFVEQRATRVLDRMPELVFDQQAFGRLARDLLAALNLADQLDTAGDRGEEGKDGEPDPNTAESEESDAEGNQRAELTADQKAQQDALSEETLDDDASSTDRLDREADARDMPRRPVHRDDHQARPGRLARNAHRQLQAVEPRHPDVDERHVRPGLEQKRERLLAIARFSHTLHLRERRQKRTNPSPHQRMIVRQQHPHPQTSSSIHRNLAANPRTGSRPRGILG